MIRVEIKLIREDGSLIMQHIGRLPEPMAWRTGPMGPIIDMDSGLALWGWDFHPVLRHNSDAASEP